METKTIIIDDKNKKFPAFIRKWFIKEYHYQGLVQIDSETEELTICGDTLKWLDKLSVETTTDKRATKLMFEFLNKKYPEYKSYIQLF